MVSEKARSWTKESVFKELKAHVSCGSGEFAVEAVDGENDSVVVSMCAVGDVPISIMMNGQEVLAEVVLISLE